MDHLNKSRTLNGRRRQWAIIGASGFVGSGIVEALRNVDEAEVHTVRAPRITCSPTSDAVSLVSSIRSRQQVIDVINELVHSLTGADTVVNAAGLAAPDASESEDLYGANSLLPVVIAEAAMRAGVQKFVHISSAAVQGSRKILDESSELKAFSPYARSKALGEETLAIWNPKPAQPSLKRLQIVTVRATSVQGTNRPTTVRLKRIASSCLASIARPGNQPSVVSSLEGLSKFVVTVGSCADRSPEILLQPWEGASVQDVMLLAGDGRKPLELPRLLARAVVNILKLCGSIHPRFRGLARRLEVMWFGQSQVSGWAVETGMVEEAVEGPTDTLRQALKSSTGPNN